MLLRCCLIHKSIVIMRKFLYLLYLYPCLEVGPFMLYLCDLFSNFMFIFIVINRTISWIQTDFLFCLFLGGRQPLYVTFSVRPSVRSSVRRAPYLRNRTSSDHNSWYTYVKWWHLQGFFSFFLNFDFLGCYEGKKGQKIAQNEK